MQKRKNEKGLTLVELLVVVTIMGLLGTIIATNYTRYVDKSKQVVVEEQLSEIVKTFEMSFVESVDYNNTILTGYSDLITLGPDVKKVYEALSGNALPDKSSLTIEGSTVTYINDGKIASYSYA